MLKNIYFFLIKTSTFNILNKNFIKRKINSDKSFKEQLEYNEQSLNRSFLTRTFHRFLFVIFITPFIITSIVLL